MRLVAVSILLAGVAYAAFVAPPNLQNLRDSSVVVRWETALAESGRVDYGLTAGYGLSVSHSSQSIDHELTLVGLLPDTTYHYRVASGADTSPDRVFLSSRSPEQALRFLVYGDNHSNDSSSHQSVVNRMIQVGRPVLAANVGDMTSNSRTVQHRSFFNIECELLGRVPLMPAVGNHDADSMPNWYRYMALPGNERWYSYRCGNSSFHSLNVNETFAPGSEQYNWFLGELLSDSADPGLRHIFVYFHLPPYTTSTVYSGNADVRQYLCPLFERFGVQLVFSGHVHAYEHSLVNGVNYIITGGGGGTLATGWNAAQPWTVYREATYEFIVVDVAGDTVRTVGVRPNGTEFDTLLLVQTGVGSRRVLPGRPSQLLVAPNPSGSRFRIETGEPAVVSVYDAAGRRVWFMGTVPPGGLSPLAVVWDASAEPAGLYYCVARTKRGASAVALVRPAPNSATGK